MQYEFIHQGDIFNSGCMALVNPVNCQGTMGKGLAKEFKKRFPENFKVYKSACESGRCRIGRCFGWEEKGTIIVNFPTKNEWRKPSEYEYIESGLKDMAEILRRLPYIKTVAIPALGCNLGGLDWDRVSDMIINGLTDNLPQDHVLSIKVYAP